LADIEPEATLVVSARMFRCPDPILRSSVNVRSSSLGLREKPIGQIAKDLGISESCLRGWVAKADVEDGRRPGVTKDEHDELVALRRELRVAKMEIEILKRAAAFFAQENVLPK
jgi:transposase-like protein